MRQCQMLKGENIAPRTVKQARDLIGKRVEYLCERDIDKSGRGYFFPQVATVTDAYQRYIELGGDPVTLKSLREMRVLDEEAA